LFRRARLFRRPHAVTLLTPRSASTSLCRREHVPRRARCTGVVAALRWCGAGVDFQEFLDFLLKRESFQQDSSEHGREEYEQKEPVRPQSERRRPPLRSTARSFETNRAAFRAGLSAGSLSRAHHCERSGRRVRRSRTAWSDRRGALPTNAKRPQGMTQTIPPGSRETDKYASERLTTAGGALGSR
jgi:hypothetical protein